jgi:hypothetical protein
MKKRRDLADRLRRSMLPVWLQRIIVYLIGPAHKVAETTEEAADELDEFGRILFAVPGYGTC